jgi:serine O-acetyltransferase
MTPAFAGGDAALNRSTHGYLAVVPRAETDEPVDPIWQRLRREAEEAYDKAPALATLFFDSIINQPSFEAAVCHRVSSRLKNDVVALPLIVQAFHRALSSDPAIGCAFKADLAAVQEKDPACDRFIEPFLYFKGFHAIQSQRVTHWLWNNGERDFALYLQSRASEVFQTDIHPAARFGQGIFLEDDVSLLQDVTLGGTGKEAGDRHPKVRRGVMIGAGAKVLGNIEIGENARIAAGSVVLRSVPANGLVAGVPAKLVRIAQPGAPTRGMEEVLASLAYDAFDWTI